MAEHEHSEPDFHDEEDGKLDSWNAWMIQRSKILWVIFEVRFCCCLSMKTRYLFSFPALSTHLLIRKILVPLLPALFNHRLYLSLLMKIKRCSRKGSWCLVSLNFITNLFECSHRIAFVDSNLQGSSKKINALGGKENTLNNKKHATEIVLGLLFFVLIIIKHSRDLRLRDLLFQTKV